MALNKERAAEERRGIVRWLRPDYQKARAGVVELRPETTEMELAPVAARGSKPAFPAAGIDQSAAVAAALLAASAPVDAAAIAAGFRQGRRAEPKVAAILAAMARTGAAATRDGGRTFQPRRVAWRAEMRFAPVTRGIPPCSVASRDASLSTPLALRCALDPPCARRPPEGVGTQGVLVGFRLGLRPASNTGLLTAAVRGEGAARHARARRWKAAAGGRPAGGVQIGERAA